MNGPVIVIGGVTISMGGIYGVLKLVAAVVVPPTSIGGLF
jgi:hypothetical protein